MRKVIVLAMVVLIAACSSSGDATTTTGATTGTDSGSADQGAVSIADFKFTPDDLTVSVGATVTWTNDDSGLAHTTTSSDGLWASGPIQPGDTFSFTFEEAGTFAYTCSIHPSMSGTITVEG